MQEHDMDLEQHEGESIITEFTLFYYLRQDLSKYIGGLSSSISY